MAKGWTKIGGQWFYVSKVAGVTVRTPAWLYSKAQRKRLGFPGGY